MSALNLGKSTPDAIRFANGECVLAAVVDYRADLAHGFRTYLPAFTLVFSLLGTGWEVEV